MRISDHFRTILVNEIRYVADKMGQSPTAEEKIYFFSGIYGMIQRMFNIEYDPDLIYAFDILHGTYQAFNARLQAMKTGADKVISLHEVQLASLTKLTEELARLIDMRKSIDTILKQFVLLSYTTTGNGHYLLEKGVLKL
jgi:hypothetical protein